MPPRNQPTRTVLALGTGGTLAPVEPVPERKRRNPTPAAPMPHLPATVRTVLALDLEEGASNAS